MDHVIPTIFFASTCVTGQLQQNRSTLFADEAGSFALDLKKGESIDQGKGICSSINFSQNHQTQIQHNSTTQHHRSTIEPRENPIQSTLF